MSESGTVSGFQGELGIVGFAVVGNFGSLDLALIPSYLRKRKGTYVMADEEKDDD